MDIDRRKRRRMMKIPASFVRCCCLIFVLLRVPTAFSSTLYFTNNSKIDRLVNNTITSVIEAENEIKALDCNSCDDRIYWTDGKEIKRGFPNESSSIELVLSFGVTKPVGVAVDWRGNNVYFTDQVLDDYASVEVVTCDGKYRRVLFREDNQVPYQSAGPIVVDSLHGYIFFADEKHIYRANMDGSSPKEIVSIIDSDEIITDLALNYDSSTLYWVHNGQINSCDYNGNNNGHIPSSVVGDTIPYSVSIDDNVLYWTQKKSINENGAIYSYFLNGFVNVSVAVGNGSSLDPYDISATVSKQVVASASSGCSKGNGGCSHFCFTMPNSTDPLAISSNVKCSCRSGFSFKANDNKTCVDSPVKFLLAAQSHSISLLSFDIPSEEYLLSLPISSDGFIDYITYDRNNHIVYWTQRDPPAIWQSELNGDNCRPLITTNIALPEGLVISDSGANLYWADSILDKIEVVSLSDGAFVPHQRHTLIDLGLEHPIGLAINESTGYIYWTDIGKDYYGVEEAAKDGTHRRKIPCTDTCYIPGPITVDPATGDVYFAVEDKDHLFYYTPTPNHTDVIRTSSIQVEGHKVSGLTILNNEVYWTDKKNGRLFKEDLSPSNGIKKGEVVAEGVGNILAVTSVDNTLPIIKTDCSLDNGECNDVCVVAQDGNNRQCLCQDNYKPSTTMETECEEESPAMIIYSTSSQVSVVHLTSSLIKRLTMDIAARAMDIDYINQDLYWIRLEDGVICTTPINTSSTPGFNHSCTPIISCCYGNISDLVVDWWGRNLYWSDSETGIIWVSKLNGTNRQMLVKNLDSPTHLVLDPYESTLYYVERHTRIRSIYMNGEESPPLSIDTVFPIRDLYVDVQSHILYWLSNNYLESYDLSNGVSSTLSPVETDTSFILGSINDKLYYYHGFGDFYDLNMGKKMFGFILDNEAVTSLIFNYHSFQPDTHWCSRTNGECDGAPEPLCLVKDYYNRTCRCDATEYLKYTYDNVRDVCRGSCLGSESFVLLSTQSEVFHLSVIEPDLPFDIECGVFAPTANELPLGDIGIVQAIAYDPFRDRVFWADSSSRDSTISSITLSGNNKQVLESYAQLNAVSMGYDWRGGNLIWSEDFATKISTVSENGQGAGVILETSYNAANYWEPIRVAVDWTKSVVYWSNSANFSLNKLSLTSLSSSYVDVSYQNETSKLLIKQLAIEPHEQLLFWYNGYNDRIEQYNIKTKQLQKIVEIDSSGNNSITAMTATTVYGHVCLFWYNLADWSVYYYNVTSTDIVKYSTMKEHTVIVSMAAYDISNYKVSVDDGLPCIEERHCSHLCSDNTKCQCPLNRELDEDGRTCSELECDDGYFSCDDNSTCYSETDRCNGIKSCDDGSDEVECDNSNYACPLLGYMQCVPGIPDSCTPLAEMCNSLSCQTDVCTCDNDDFFLCEKDVSRKCIPNAFKCDPDFIMCHNSQDCEPPTPMPPNDTTPTTRSSPPTTTDDPTLTKSEINSIVASIVSVVGIISVLTAIGICAIAGHCFIMARRSKNIDIRHEVFSLKTTSSHQHSPVQSICTSDLSINTMVTGSTNVDKTSQEARLIKRLSTLSTDPSNPPNSPITRRSVAFTMGDEVTMYSEFDPPIPPPPNPSIDYDTMSEGITSVSQRKFPGVIPMNGFQPRIDEDHGESPPPPYCNHPMYQPDDESVDIAPYSDYCPPIIPHHLTEMVHLDDISQSTFSMTMTTATDLVSDHHFMDHHGFQYTTDNSEQQSQLSVEDRRIPEDHHLEEGHVIHPYDRPPPPSPVTLCSIHGE